MKKVHMQLLYKMFSVDMLNMSIILYLLEIKGGYFYSCSVQRGLKQLHYWKNLK